MILIFIDYNAANRILESEDYTGEKIKTETVTAARKISGLESNCQGNIFILRLQLMITLYVCQSGCQALLMLAPHALRATLGFVTKTLTLVVTLNH